MKKNYLVAISFLIFLATRLLAQTECINGYAGMYPCNDYDLMATIDLAAFGANSGSDSWGWTDTTTGKEYALVGLNNATAFVDITNPVNLIYLGTLPTATTNSSWRDIKVYQDHAFIVSEASNHGMQVFDLTRLRNVANPPETFTADAHYTGFGSAHNIVINEATGYAYAVGARNYGTSGYNFSGGAHFINIQNPINPIAAGGYAASGYTHDAQVIIYNGPDTDHTGKEIYIGSNEDKIVIVDVTDKNNPVQIGNDITYSGVGYTHQGWLTEDHTYYFLGDEYDEITNGNNTRTYIFDFTDLDNPTHLVNYDSNNASIDHNGYILGNTFYLASYRAGLRVLDITNKTAIQEIGFFDTYPNNDNANFSGAWNVYPYFSSGNIVISDINRGLFVVRKSGTLATPEFTAASFSVSPNPAKEQVTIKAGANSKIKNVEVYSILGKKIFQKNTINASQYVIPTLQFTKGVYILKINKTETKKLIIR